MDIRWRPGSDPRANGKPDVMKGTEVQRKATVQADTELAGVNILQQGSRAGDADRDRVIHHLGAVHGGGYIDAEEFHARMEIAAKATTRRKLNQLVEDLPALPLPEKSGVKLTWRSKASAGFAASLLTAIGGPVLLYNMTGYYFTVQGESGTHFGHAGPDILLMVVLAIVGIIGCIASITYGVAASERMRTNGQDRSEPDALCH